MKKILAVLLILTLLPVSVFALEPAEDCCGTEEIEVSCCIIEPDPPLINPRDADVLVGVTRRGNDDVGQILQYFGAGVDFQVVGYRTLSDLETLNQFFAIFINCGSQGDVDPRVLREYVAQGGVVYASDHAAAPLRQAFPDILNYRSAPSQTVRSAEIPHSALAAHMRSSEIDVLFDLSDWYVLTELSDEATVYIQGEVRGQGVRPLAMSFNYGRGTVFYTSFHNSAQATSNMINFIEYLVFRIQFIEADRDLAYLAERDGFTFDGSLYGFFGDDSDAFLYEFDSEDFQVMFAPGMSNANVRLTDPYGNVIVANEAGEVIAMEQAANAPPPSMELNAIEGGGGLRITGGQTGQWSIEVESEDADPSEAFAIGIAQGNTQTTQTGVSRAEFVQALADASDADLTPYTTATPTFSDVPNTSPYFAAVQWAAQNGITSGDGRGNFNPATRINREQMFTMLYSFAIAQGVSLPSPSATSYTDTDAISPWARNAVLSLHAAGIVLNRPGGVFDPQGFVTTSESSFVIEEFVDMILD